MSTRLPPLAASGLAPSARPALARRTWLREPLLHFLVLGAVLFGLDHALVARTDDRHVIVMGSAVDAEARQLFKASRGREPGAAEMAALRKVWLDNEVLYREGMAMQMDKGDSAIRERVIFKALSVVDANVKLPPIDDKVLRGWFDAHRAKYDDPARFDFQEAALAGDTSEATVREFVARLEGGTSGDAGAGLRVFKGRPSGNLEDSYGGEFTKALQAAPTGHWQALHAKDGWRAVVLDRYTPPTPADFQKLRSVVQQDWTDATLAEQRSAAVRRLAAKYDIRTAAAK
ncbi:MAG: peptidylprolyl isomerase [Burkholderiaceae bacterium]